MEQEQQPIPVCWRCDQEIHQDQQQTELLCHHRMHTNCFLQIAHLNYACPHCNEAINPNVAFYQNDNLSQDSNRVLQLYNTNQTFRDLAVKIAKKRRLLSSKRTGYQKLIKTKKLEIRNQLLAIKAQLEGITETKKTEIRNSTVYKEYMSAYRSYILLLGKMRNDHNCSERKLARGLREKPGFRRFTPYHFSRYRRNDLSRAFYFRIRT